MALRFFRLRLCLALALISAAVIAYQLALMQILSLVQWHHFAYLIIAVALLGFGAAGTLLSLLRVCLMANFALVLPLVLFLSGAAMALMPGIAQCTPVRFDSLLLFTDIRHLFKLLAACGFYFFPFFLAALAIGMIFVDAARDIGRLYFWNLTGSGAGGAAMTGLLWLFPPPALPALAALAAVAAAALVLPEGLQGPVRYGNPAGSGDAQSEQGRDSPGIQGGAPGDLPQLQRRGMLITVAVLSGLSAVFFLVRPPAPVLSDYKTLSRALQVGEAKIVHERESPYGFMQVLSSPSLRYAPGLSLVYPGRIPVTKAVFNNGDWFGAVVPWPGGPGVVSGLHDRCTSLRHRDMGACSAPRRGYGHPCIAGHRPGRAPGHRGGASPCRPFPPSAGTGRGNGQSLPESIRHVLQPRRPDLSPHGPVPV